MLKPAMIIAIMRPVAESTSHRGGPRWAGGVAEASRRSDSLSGTGSELASADGAALGDGEAEAEGDAEGLLLTGAVREETCTVAPEPDDERTVIFSLLAVSVSVPPAGK